MNAKPFFVVITFVLLIALFAGGSMSTVDLTPGTPRSANTASGFNDVNSFTTAGNPIDSPCGSSYTVRSGDTLSRIALACNVTLSDLLAANPSIINPNLIHPNQKLNIYYAPLTAAPITAAPAATAILPAAVTDASIPVSGLVPGGSFHITVTHLAPNTPVDISIGKMGDKPVKLEEGHNTDAAGKIDISVAIPPTAKKGEQWVVTITTLYLPAQTVTSEPFTIQ